MVSNGKWQLDAGHWERRLFLVDSFRYRLERAKRWLFRERTIWVIMVLCAAYMAGAVMHGALA